MDATRSIDAPQVCALCGEQAEYIGVMRPHPGQPGPRWIIYGLCARCGATRDAITRVEARIYDEIAQSN